MSDELKSESHESIVLNELFESHEVHESREVHESKTNKDLEETINSIETLTESKSVIIQCSKKCDPYLSIVSAAATIGKDREIRSLVENLLADWLDNNKNLYEVIKKQKPHNIVKQTLSNIYEQDTIIINKTLNQICDEINKYYTTL